MVNSSKREGEDHGDALFHLSANGKVVEIPGLSVAEKQALLRNRRSKSERTYRRMIAQHREKELKPGKGRGLEPKPWCECHSRNPCPIDMELIG